jgi:hypothetical protein
MSELMVLLIFVRYMFDTSIEEESSYEIPCKDTQMEKIYSTASTTLLQNMKSFG